MVYGIYVFVAGSCKRIFTIAVQCLPWLAKI